MRGNPTIPESNTTSTPPCLPGTDLGKPEHGRVAMFERRDFAPLEGNIDHLVESVNYHQDCFACGKGTGPMRWHTSVGKRGVRGDKWTDGDRQGILIYINDIFVQEYIERLL